MLTRRWTSASGKSRVTELPLKEVSKRELLLHAPQPACCRAWALPAAGHMLTRTEVGTCAQVSGPQELTGLHKRLTARVFSERALPETLQGKEYVRFSTCDECLKWVRAVLPERDGRGWPAWPACAACVDRSLLICCSCSCHLASRELPHFANSMLQTATHACLCPAACPWMWWPPTSS